MPRSLLVAAFLAGTLCAGACATTSLHPALPPATAVSSIPPLSTADDVDEALNEYAALPLAHAAREPLRRALLGALDDRVQRALALGAASDAFDSFEQAMSLYDPSELRQTASLLDAPALVDMATRIDAAFSPRGGDQQVLTALAVQLSAHPGDAQLLSQFHEAATWSDDAFTATNGPAFRGSHLAEVAGQIGHDWPSPFVVQQGIAWYSEQEAALKAAVAEDAVPQGFVEQLGGQLVKESYGLARLYIEAGDLDGAAKAAAALEGDPFADTPPLRTALQAAAAPGAGPDDYLALARLFQHDQDVAFEVCRMAVARFPKDKSSRELAAALAFHDGRTALAARLLEEIHALAPADRDDARTLATVYGQRLQELESETDLERIDAMLARALAYDGDLHSAFPDLEIDPPPAALYVLAAHGYLDAGQVGKALDLLGRSVALAPNLDALELRGQIEAKTGKTAAAVEDYEAASAIQEPKPDLQQFDGARLLREEGDAYAASGDAKRAAVAYRLALSDWDQLFGIQLNDDAAAQGWLERGRLYYALGEIGKALAAFDHARATKTDRAGTYVDELSFLVPRGQLGDAVDVYHAALKNAGLSDYFRAYTTFWIVDLARLEGVPADPQALAALDNLSLPSWFGDLARYHAGAESEKALEAHAVTPGEHAEMWFYEGVARAVAGKPDAARALFQKVADSGMVDYLEYDMAQYFLAHGIPRTSMPRVARPPAARPANAGPATPAPADGTI